MDGQPLTIYLQRRTATLVSGVTVGAARIRGRRVAIEFPPEPNRSSYLSLAHASAIATDGYFLTAAHCVGDPVNYLVNFDGHTARIGIPRVVAKVTDRRTCLDLALLHVDAKLAEAFVWADRDAIAIGGPVIAVGNSEPALLDDKHLLLKPACLAGHITAVKQLTDGAMMVSSDAPAREGDSGGPLLDQNGRLIGIQAKIRADWRRNLTSLAFQPDRAWIDRVIKRDRQTSIPKSKTRLPAPRKGSGNPGIIISLE